MNAHAQQPDSGSDEIAAIRRSIENMAEQIRLLRVPISPVLTLEESAKVLGCSHRTVRRLIDRGCLPAVRLPSARGHGTVLRIQASDLQGLIDRQRTPPTASQAKSDDHKKKSIKKVRVPLIDL